MAYAHQGVELRPLAGLPPPEHAPTVTDTSFKGGEEPHPALLTRKGTEALTTVERMLDDAAQALGKRGAPAASLPEPVNGNKLPGKTVGKNEGKTAASGAGTLANAASPDTVSRGD
jgi:hypothetical protein